METGRKKVRLGELLVNSGVITAEQLQQALDNLRSVVSASRLQYQTQRQRHPALFAKLL